ncbi:MAG: hypothetical protein E1N59_2582 [Puniceicoccaceae bacterium 5H]|nr:MAG: hypothetical protein E1N59_2582 [Puniceicoccaceae bacterium 5H]
MPFEFLAKAHSFDDQVWMRHANPWSVWTRFIILPLLSLAVWSRIWIGWWSLIPTVLLLAWAWLNPRVFPRPKRTTSWASRAVLGERLWVESPRYRLPARHRIMPMVLAIVSSLGLPYVGWGLIALHEWSLYLGLALAILGKMWFLDRMVWLYEDMHAAGHA